MFDVFNAFTSEVRLLEFDSKVVIFLSIVISTNKTFYAMLQRMFHYYFQMNSQHSYHYLNNCFLVAAIYCIFSSCCASEQLNNYDINLSTICSKGLKSKIQIFLSINFFAYKYELTVLKCYNGVLYYIKIDYNI